MSRIRSKINRGECLSASELAKLENLTDQEISIYVKVLGKIMHRTVFSKLKKIQSVRKSAKDQAEKQRLEQIESDKEVASKQKLFIEKLLPNKLQGGNPLTEAELEFLDALEIIQLRELSIKYKSDMHPNAVRKIKDILSRMDSPEVGKKEHKSLTKNGWSRLEGRSYKK